MRDNRRPSILVFCLSVLLACKLTINDVAAHTFEPAIVELSVTADQLTVVINAPLEAMVSGTSLRFLDDYALKPQKERYEALRNLPPGLLEKEVRQAWPSLSGKISLRVVGKNVPLEIESVTIPPVGDLMVQRTSRTVLTGALPTGDDPFTFGWVEEFGPLLLRRVGDADDGYIATLMSGTSSHPIARNSITVPNPLSVFTDFVQTGFVHVLPGGIDHMLFVLGLFFYGRSFRSLILQVSSFTLAHTITLAAATMGYVNVPSAIVEPLIAASIIFVGMENIVGSRLRVARDYRLGVVLVFGLLHGLGFAAALEEFGLGGRSFFSALFGFNIGVEIAQLAIVIACYACFGYWFWQKPWYANRIAWPASVAVVAGGFYFLWSIFAPG